VRLLTAQSVRSICVHGDNPAAVQFVREIREKFLALGHTLRTFV
jgi:lactam utilization protein B